MTIDLTKVFTKYRELADCMVSPSGFGTSCQLVYTDKVEINTADVPDIKQRKRMNLQHGSSPDGFNRGDVSYKTVETTEDITLRTYWSQRDFKRVSSAQYPDGTLMTIGAFSDVPKVTRAKALLVNTDKTGSVDWKFTRTTEPFPYGLDDNSFVCFWERS